MDRKLENCDDNHFAPNSMQSQAKFQQVFLKADSKI